MIINLTKMEIYKLTEQFTPQQLKEFHDFIYHSEWFYGAPGGFLTNFPQRKVNAYGNGAPISNDGIVYGEGWNETHWTAKMNASNVSLHTKPEQMPQPLANLIPKLRKLFLKIHPNAKITDNTFTIAVCNYYTDPDMNIAAHTDSNIWYPHECEAGPVFASFTLYPDKKPLTDKEYARFQIRETSKDSWKQINLPHDSVMIMPSGIEHRVQSHSNRLKPHFRPRINITFRSTFPREINPLMNIMAVSNHTRYYRIPHAITFPNNIDNRLIKLITKTYNTFAKKHKRPIMEIDIRNNEHISERQRLIRNYKKKYGNFKTTTNMVIETFRSIN